VVVKLGYNAGLSRRRPRVQVPSTPQILLAFSPSVD
jgi:hypothetical protein